MNKLVGNGISLKGSLSLKMVNFLERINGKASETSDVIGIYLAGAPGQMLLGQGIGRVLATLIEGFLSQSEATIVIAAPSWYKKELDALFEDHHLPKERLQFILSRRLPLWVYFLNFKGQPRRNYFGTINTWVMNQLHKYIFSLLSTEGVLLIAISGLFFVVPVTFFSLFRVLLALLSWLWILFEKLLKSGISLIIFLGSFIAYGREKGIIKGILQRKIEVRALFQMLKGDPFFIEVYDQLRQKTIFRLISKMNERRDVKAWFVPTMFWPEVSLLKARVVMAAPDLVPVEFPSLFCSPHFKDILNTCLRSLMAADSIICYSDYVKERHLVGRAGISSSKVHVIRNGIMDLSVYLRSSQTEMSSASDMRAKALEILKNYRGDGNRIPYPISSFLENVFPQRRYVFYATQFRPHKNILTLIKAIEKVREQRIDYPCLVLTADLDATPQYKRFIAEAGLTHAVTWMKNVPSRVLAALNALAELVVVPTLFEGGFVSFSFSEAYSVGTPVLLSRIPVNREVIQEPELDRAMLFDPFDIDDIARKINWAINNREKLLLLQAPLFQRLRDRPWGQIAQEYLNVLFGNDCKVIPE